METKQNRLELNNNQKKALNGWKSSKKKLVKCLYFVRSMTDYGQMLEGTVEIVHSIYSTYI
jgi:hypothetical protein